MYARLCIGNQSVRASVCSAPTDFGICYATASLHMHKKHIHEICLRGFDVTHEHMRACSRP